MPRLWVICAASAWIALVAVGLAAAGWHETTAGRRGEAPARWPLDTHVARIPGHPTVVMFVHPQCPCTRASLAELRRIMIDPDNDASTVVAFVLPEGAGDDWEHTDAWTTAAELPRTTRFVDHTGSEAARFGAATSGHVVVYDASGALVFSGGITGSRGHAGANVGARTVLAHATRRSSDEHVHDVFGCALEDR